MNALTILNRFNNLFRTKKETVITAEIEQSEAALTPFKKFYSERALKTKQAIYQEWADKQEAAAKALAECDALYDKYASNPIAVKHLLDIYTEKSDELEKIAGEMIAAGMPSRMDEDERPVYYHQRSGTVWVSGRVPSKIM